MRLTGGSVTFEDRSQNVLVHLPVWDLAVDGSALSGVQEIQLKTRQASEVLYNGKMLAVHNIDARLALKQRNETLDVHSAQLSSGVGDVAISGTVENLKDPPPGFGNNQRDSPRISEPVPVDRAKD